MPWVHYVLLNAVGALCVIECSENQIVLCAHLGFLTENWAKIGLLAAILWLGKHILAYHLKTIVDGSFAYNTFLLYSLVHIHRIRFDFKLGQSWQAITWITFNIYLPFFEKTMMYIYISTPPQNFFDL